MKTFRGKTLLISLNSGKFLHAECVLVMGRDTRHHYKSCPHSNLYSSLSTLVSVLEAVILNLFSAYFIVNDKKLMSFKKYIYLSLLLKGSFFIKPSLFFLEIETNPIQVGV